MTGAHRADKDDGLDRAVRLFAYRLRRGESTLARHGDAQRQAQAYADGMARMRIAEARTREILDARGTACIEYVFYFAFAYRLAKLCRNYSSTVLERETASLIDTWTSRGLDRETLEAVSRRVKELSAG